MIFQIDEPIVVVCANGDGYAMPFAALIRSVIESLSGDRQVVFL